MGITKVIVGIAFLSIILIKILNIYYNYNVLKDERAKTKKNKHVNLLGPIASYKQFEEASKETLVHNSPVRVDGDFMDFIIENISDSDKGIETKVLKINQGENNER